MPRFKLLLISMRLLRAKFPFLTNEHVLSLSSLLLSNINVYSRGEVDICKFMAVSRQPANTALKSRFDEHISVKLSKQGILLKVDVSKMART